MTLLDLHPVALTREGFALFGDVISTDGAASHAINEGTTERFHDLAAIDVVQAGGRPLVNIFRGQPRQFPYRVSMMERHPLASQAFIPLNGRPYLIVVAAADARPLVEDLRVFRARGDQGINYNRGVWHHPLLALDRESDFLVIDRGGEGHNLDEIELEPEGNLLATI